MKSLRTLLTVSSLIWLFASYGQSHAQHEFITTWQTTTANESITIPTFLGESYNYTVNWGDGSATSSGATGDVSHTYTTAGTYTVTITGTFPRIYFNSTGDRTKIQSIEQWGSIQWTSMQDAFAGCDNLTYNAVDAPDLSGVQDMSRMFQQCKKFNGAIGNWDISNVTNLSHTFNGALIFNQDIGSWNTANVTDMERLFENAKLFNQDIGNWNTSKVANMYNLFHTNEAFDQNLGNWDMSQATHSLNLGVWFALDHGMSTENYDKTLIGWAKQSLPSGRVIVFFNLNYCHGATAKQSIVDNFGWTILDGGQNCTNREFITTWQTTTANESITIPTFSGESYNYTVDWGDGSTASSGVTGDTSHTYTTAGTYTVTITGEFPRIYFNNGGDRTKIQTIEQWGTIHWSSMGNAFLGCTNLNENATDAPDLSSVSSLENMFAQCSSLNGDISNWDVSKITTMRGLFLNAIAFNQDISSWNVSNVTNMSNMFNGTQAYNQPLSSWDVSNVNTMESMFSLTTAFNQDINSWNVSNVTDMSNMFNGAQAFNQPLSSWDVSNVTDMRFMFIFSTAFNQDINDWNTSSLTNLERTFNDASAFNQNLSAWNVSNVTDMYYLFEGSALSTSNYDLTLIGWASQSLKPNVELGVQGKTYCLAAVERQQLIDNYSWIITDAGSSCTLTNWNGSTWDNGTPTSSVSAAINGSYDATAHGDITCEHLGIKPSITLTVPTGDSVITSGYLMNLGTITLQSDAAFVQTAVSPSNVGTGTYTAQQEASPFWLEYNYWASPLQNITIGEVFDSSTPNKYTFLAATQSWSAVNSSTTMPAGTGYIASGNSGTTTGTLTRSFSNTLGFNSGNYNHTVTFNNDADATNDWNLIGNPYPSGIDVASFLNTNYNGGSGVIDNAVYVWNSDGNDVGSLSSDYATMNIAGVVNAGGSTGPSSATIASCQGFMVRAIAAGDCP